MSSERRAEYLAAARLLVMSLVYSGLFAFMATMTLGTDSKAVTIVGTIIALPILALGAMWWYAAWHFVRGELMGVGSSIKKYEKYSDWIV